MNILNKNLNNTNHINSKFQTTKRNSNEQRRENYNKNRPAQEISFGGSAVSAAQSVSHKLINFVYDNEAAYNAFYSLLFAGILKPICILNSKGSEEKDKQIVATKNFLQAFIGSFLGLTVGGGFIKKSIDVIKTNLKLIAKNEDKTAFEAVSDQKAIDKQAISVLEKERGGLKEKYKALKQEKGAQGFDIKSLFEAFTKKASVGKDMPDDFDSAKQIFIKLSDDEIKQKGKSLVERAQEHVKIFNRNKDSVGFIDMLLTNGSDELIRKQKDGLVELVKNGANESQIKEQYDNLMKNILDRGQTGCKSKISNLAKDVENNLGNKDTFENIINTFYKTIEDKNYLADETLMDTFESFWKNSTGWATAIAKAKVSSLLLPGVMAALFVEKKIQEAQTLTNSATFNNEKQKYQPIFNNKYTNNSAQPNFTGAMDKPIDVLAKGIEYAATSKAGQKVVDAFHKLPRPLNKTSARTADLESAIITGYWVQNTMRSKKIEPDQKLGLNVHTVLVTIVSSTCAFLLDTLLDPLIDHCKKNYKKTMTETAKKAVENIEKGNAKSVLEEGCARLLDNDKVVKKLEKTITSSLNPKELLEDNSDLFKEIDNLTKTYGKKLSKFKSLTVFTAIVRFLVPVVMVPYSAKLKNYIKEKQNAKNAQNNQDNKKLKTAA